MQQKLKYFSLEKSANQTQKLARKFLFNLSRRGGTILIEDANLSPIQI